MKRARWWLLVGAAGAVMRFAGLAACTGDTSAGSSCPISPSATCPSSPPSWKTDVQPIIDGHCGPCHLAGGVETKVPRPLDYSTYAGVQANYSTIRLAVATCVMPPADAGALTAAEGETLLEWLVCGAPDN